MMKQCPKCGQINVQTAEHEGRKRSACGSCGWIGPGCYGDKWEAHNPKCAGGNDRTFWDDDRKSHKRPQCGVYQPCAAEMNRQRIQGFVPVQNLLQGSAPTPMQIPMPQMQQVPVVQYQQPAIPYKQPPQVTVPMPDGTRKTLTLAAPPSPTAPRSVQVKPPNIPSMQPQPMAQPQPQMVQGQVQPMMYQTYHQGQPMTVMMVPPQNAGVPMLVPQNMVQPGTQVMAVITVPEPEELPYFKRFAGSVGRSMLKYGFLSAANMMDHVPWWGR